MADRQLTVTLVGDARSLDRAFGRAGDSAERFSKRGSKSMKAFEGAVAGAAAGVALFALNAGKQLADSLIRGSIAAASDLEESMSKVSVVFGDAAEDVIAFGEDAATATGLATQEALEAAGTFGNLFTAMGLGQEEAADLSTNLVQLAADFASFNNIGVDEALVKLRAGLVGEVEPLRALGVQLTAATVAAEAMKLGLADSTDELTEAAKVQARYSLILQQSTNAQGDFARTSDGLANSSRTLNAQFKDLQASIGKALIPSATKLIHVLSDLMPLFEEIAVTVAELFATIGPVVEATIGFGKAVRDLTEDVKNALGPLGDFLALMLKLADPMSLAGEAAKQAAPILSGMAEVEEALAEATAQAQSELDAFNETLFENAGFTTSKAIPAVVAHLNATRGQAEAIQRAGQQFIMWRDEAKATEPRIWSMHGASTTLSFAVRDSAIAMAHAGAESIAYGAALQIASLNAAGLWQEADRVFDVVVNQIRTLRSAQAEYQGLADTILGAAEATEGMTHWAVKADGAVTEMLDDLMFGARGVTEALVGDGGGGGGGGGGGLSGGFQKVGKDVEDLSGLFDVLRFRAEKAIASARRASDNAAWLTVQAYKRELAIQQDEFARALDEMLRIAAAKTARIPASHGIGSGTSLNSLADYIAMFGPDLGPIIWRSAGAPTGVGRVIDEDRNDGDRRSGRGPDGTYQGPGGLTYEGGVPAGTYVAGDVIINTGEGVDLGDLSTIVGIT